MIPTTVFAHMFYHLMQDVSETRRNPRAWWSFKDEECMGRLARIACCVHAVTVANRTLQRWCVQFYNSDWIKNKNKKHLIHYYHYHYYNHYCTFIKSVVFQHKHPTALPPLPLLQPLLYYTNTTTITPATTTAWLESTLSRFMGISKAPTEKFLMFLNKK